MRSVFKKSLAAFVLTVPAAAFAGAPADVQKQIDELQQQVAQLQAQQAKADQAVIDAVRKDAEHRRPFSLSDAAPFANNYDSGRFILQSDDGNFLLHPWFQLQIRNGTTYRDRVSKADVDSDLQNGFEIRRMKFGVDGNAFSPATTYSIYWNTDRNTGTLTLEEAWVRTKISDDWAVRGGQMKDLFAHESLVSSKKVLATELTLLTDLFAGGSNYVQAALISYSHDAFQFEGGLTDGANESNRNFQDFPTNAWDYGAVGRVQYKVMGDWSAYDQFSSLNLKKDLLVFGGAVDYSEAGNTGQLLHTVDVQYNNTAGLGLFGAYYGRFTRNAPKSVTAVATDDTYDLGFIAQASYLIPDTKWEPFARYDFIKFDSNSVAAGDRETVHEITAGVNYYFHGQAAKFTLDVTYLPNGSPFSDTGSDVLSSPNSEIVVRGQFQLLL